MATQTEQLVVQLEARIRDFERNFQRANQTASRNWSAMEQRGRQAGTRMKADMDRAGAGVVASVRSMGAGLTRALGIGTLGFAALGAGARSAISSLAEIRGAAARAGIATDTFQELRYAAEISRVPIDALTDGLKELSLRADEFLTTGGGPAAEALARIGLTGDDLRQRLQSPADLLTEIIRRVERLDRAAQIRIFDELFGGTGGEQFLRFLDAGADGIAALRQEARESGVVINDELLRRAEEVDRQFQRIAITVETALKGAIVSAADALSYFFDLFNEVDRRTNETIMEQIRLKNDAIAAWMNSGLRNWIGDGALLQNLYEDRNRLLEEMRRRARANGPDNPPSAGGGPLDITVTAPLPPLPTPPATSTGGGGRASSAAATRMQADAVEELIGTLEDELAAIHMTEAEQRIMEELRRAGADATDEQRNRIADLVTAIEEERASVEQLEERMQAFGDGAREVLGGIVSDIRAGATAADVLQNALDRIISRLADAALNRLIDAIIGGIGTAGGDHPILNAILGRARGGWVHGPGTATSDSIPAMLSDGEFVIKASEARRHRQLLEAINSGALPRFANGGAVGSAPTASRGGDRIVTIAPAITVNAAGGTPEANTDLAVKIGREVEARMKQTVIAEIVRQQRPGGVLY